MSDIALFCPKCDFPLRETDWGWTCTNYDKESKTGCDFHIGNTILDKKITENDVRNILELGDSGLLKGFKSKKGNRFDAHLVLEEDGKIGFKFESSEPDKATDTAGNVLKCPVCGRDMVVHKWGYGCSGYRDGGCKFSVSYEICKKRLSQSQMANIIADGDSGLVQGFVSPKSGKTFDAHLVVNGSKVEFSFEK